MTEDLCQLSFDALVARVRACTICADKLPNEPKPVIQLSANARILVVGQAPGRRVHDTGLPFNDPSGDRLRQWLGVSRETFYDAQTFAILPMGFCYPGTGKSGDLPPRPECAPAWRSALTGRLKDVRLTVIIGRYAHDWHLGRSRQSVAGVVRQWRRFWPDSVPLPHPSPRNNRWLKSNPWFEAEIVPALQTRVTQVLNNAQDQA